MSLHLGEVQDKVTQVTHLEQSRGSIRPCLRLEPPTSVQDPPTHDPMPEDQKHG